MIRPILTILGVLVACALALSFAASAQEPFERDTTCPDDMQRPGALCSSPADGLYEYAYRRPGQHPDDVRAWCRVQGKNRWCTTLTDPVWHE